MYAVDLLDRWHPGLHVEFGLKKRDVDDLTPVEFDAYERAYEQRVNARKQQT